MGQIINANSDWTKYTLGDLGRYLNGRAFGKDEWKENGLPIIRIQNLNDPDAKFNYADGNYEDRYKVTNGDLLVSWAASLGVYLWNRGDAWLNQHIFKVEPNDKLVTKDFLHFLLKATLNQLLAKTHGTGMVHITKGDFDNQEVFIPTIPEQEQIVEKLQLVLPLASVNADKIKLAKLGIAKFRQSILSAAVTGKLTEDWREGHENEDNETLSTIKFNLKNYNDRVKVKKHRADDFDEYEFDSSIKYPDTWELENLGNISELVTDGEHITPKRTPDGKLLLSARNIQNGYISLEKVDHIPDEEFIRITKRCNPQKDDVLISCSGSVGRVSLVPEGMEFTMVRSVALVKVQENKFLSKYLEFYLQSPVAQNQIYKLQKATAQANLFIGQIKKIVVLLPPEKEIEEIVKRVKFNFEMADKAEEQIAAAEAKVSKLTQAVLAKTFSNEGATI